MASLILALAVALLPADRHVRDVVPALPIVDARQLEEDALVDLDRLAKEFGAPKGFTFRRLLPVQVLAVLDVHVLRIASQRGVETVALHDLGGRDPRLPAEVDAWLCDVARPRVEAILREPGVLLFEVEGPRESVWDHPDREGRRLVEIVLHDEHGERSLGGILLAEGLAWLARDHRDLLGARGIVALLSAPSTPDSGLKLLPSLVAARDARACALAEVLLLDDARLTRRAQQIQAELASLLGWRPRELVEVRLLDDEAVALRLEEERERAAQAGEPVHDSATEMEFVARALRGPDILVRRAALSDSVLDLALLDEVLAHEVAHQYQEEAGFWAWPQFLPVEGHAHVLARRWLASKGRLPAGLAYPAEELELETLVQAWGCAPDDVLRRFQRLGPLASDWRGARIGLVAFAGLPDAPDVGPAPRIELLPAWVSPVPEPLDPPGTITVRVGNPHAVTLRGRLDAWSWRTSRTLVELHGRSGCTLPLEAPAVDIVLPPGRSVRLRMKEPPSGQHGRRVARVAASWSPTRGESRRRRSPRSAGR